MASLADKSLKSLAEEGELVNVGQELLHIPRKTNATLML